MMQDIDFDALDAAVSKAMNQKQQQNEQRQRLQRQRQRNGGHMDIVKNSRALHASKSATNGRLVIKADASKTQLPAKQLVKSQVKVQSANSMPVKKASEARISHADLLRQRRRMSAPAAQPVTNLVKNLNFQTDQAIIKGQYHDQTVSKKQPDGSEIIYNQRKLDYVAEIGKPNHSKSEVLVKTTTKPSPATQPRRVPALSTSLRSTGRTIDQIRRAPQINISKPTVSPAQPSPTAQSSKSVAARPVINLDAKAQAQPVKFTPTHQPALVKHNQSTKASPFLETVKVEKRPLGNPVQKNNFEDLKVDSEQTEIKSVNLYRGDLHMAPDSATSKKSLATTIWIILLSLVLVGLVIYLIYLYNK